MFKVLKGVGGERAFKGASISALALITVFFAGIVVSIAPIVIFYILMEKNVVAGLTAGAVKG